MNFSPNNGLEVIQRAAFLRLFDHLNDIIAEVEDKWAESDETFADHIGVPYVPLVVHRIANTNFYEGHRPSLIKAPIDKYPNVSVWGVRATPHAENAASDHTNIFSNLLYVEVMCNSIEDEGIVNKRLVRTCEALNAVMLADPTLGGVVTGMAGDVSLSVSDVFTRRENTSYGSEWFWQGARLEYVVRKDSVLPSTTTGSIFRSGIPAGMTAADIALIDQA